MRIPVTLTPDDNGTLLVTCSSLPEVTSFGDDHSDALDHAKDAVLTALDGRIRNRQAIPAPVDRGEPAVMLSALVDVKIALHNAMIEADVRKAELGRRLKASPPTIDRLLDLDHGSKLDQLEAALAAVGLELAVSTRAACPCPSSHPTARCSTPSSRRSMWHWSRSCAASKTTELFGLDNSPPPFTWRWRTAGGTFRT